MGKIHENKRKPKRAGKWTTVGREAAIPQGRGATVKLNDGAEIAVFNHNGDFYAIENFCPHKGRPLAGSPLDGTVVECEFHDWRFDLRTGECFKRKDCSIESYAVAIEDGWIKILV